MISHLLCQSLTKSKHFLNFKQLNQCFSEFNIKFVSNFFYKNKLSIDESLLKKRTSLHVIGNGSDANPCAVCLSIDERFYLFNCGQGLQRLYTQYKLKIPKTHNLFLTSNKWHNISGISGFMLNRFDSGVKHLNIYSTDCEKLIDIITYFDHKFNYCVFNTTDYRLIDEYKPFIDDFVEIQPIVVKTDENNNINSDITVAYICKIKPKFGDLLIEKCFRMKIPRKLVPELQSGQSVVLESGVTVTPEEVHTPHEPEQCFVVLECRTHELLEQFLNNEEFLSQIKANNCLIECVVHMTPEDVINASDYKKMILKFSPETKHLALNRQNPSFGLHSIHRFQTQLNSLDDRVFPNIAEKIETNKRMNTLNENLFNDRNVFKCQTGLQYLLRPSAERGFSFDVFDSVNHKFLIEDALKLNDGSDREGFDEYLKQLKQKQQILENNSNNCQSFTDSYPEIVFLGTGSAEPSASRNVTSVLVNITDNSSILLDCGEDTCGQLFRFYGSTQIKTFYSKLNAIFVSHIHTDHHIGLITLIENHFLYTSKPLVLFIPPMIIEWLNHFNIEYERISHKYKAFSTTEMPSIDSKQIFNDLRLKELKAIPVIHCIDSFGVVLQTLDNKVIVFSGDTVPSDELIQCGLNCDVLIHEATQDDSLQALAKTQWHSTVSEAIDVGRRMSAKFTILTHFSQRYGKLPLIPETELSNDRLGIAYDFMRVSLPELSRLPLLLPALQCFYKTHLEKINHKILSNSRRI